MLNEFGDIVLLHHYSSPLSGKSGKEAN